MLDLLALLTQLWLHGGGVHTNDDGGGSDKGANLGGPARDGMEVRDEHLDSLAARITTTTLG